MKQLLKRRYQEFYYNLGNDHIDTRVAKQLYDNYCMAEQETINKVCEYLRNHIDPKLTIYHNDTWCSLDEFIDKMKKAMEL